MIDVTAPQRATPTERDATLAAAACDALKWHSQVPEHAVQVEVHQGWITLSGVVELDHQRRGAEQALRCLDGVQGVSNCIRLKDAVLPADVHLHVADGLVKRAQEAARHIEVFVDGACVTLRGKLHSWSEREAAESAAWAVHGVSKVINEIKLLP